MYSVCAVIVTYNRKELLMRNLDSLLIQDYPLHIVIYDNASTDGTEESVRAYIDRLKKKNNISYFKSEKNLGGSGGFFNGEKIGIEMGFDYIWLMDDDGYCLNKQTLSTLINALDESNSILNSYVTCNAETLEPTFGLDELSTKQEIMNASKNGIFIGSGNPYNGTLIPAKCFKEIGYTDSRFFIYGDEYEYIIRSQKAGYVWKTVVNSLYYHPVNRAISRRFSIFGKVIEVKKQPIWKQYLEIRNDTYIKKKYFNKKITFFTVLKVFILSMLSENKKIKRFYYSILAIKDAGKEYFERDIMFKA